MDPESAKSRYLFIDALRGIAALGVLFHHLYYNSVLQEALQNVFPDWVTAVLNRGAFGVEVFFVLSGFVIAHSIRDLSLSARSAGTFLLRRQIRLDPPYWTVILLTLTLHWVELNVPGLRPDPLPSLPAVLQNVFYVHQIMDTRAVLDVAWTLCLEVQFYLVFILILASMNRVGGRSSATELRPPTLVLVTGLGLISLIDVQPGVEGPFFLSAWFYFAAGVLCCWATHGRIRGAIFWSFMLAFALSTVLHLEPRMVSGWIAAALLYLAGQMGGLKTWLSWAPLQYFGRISYSLYLIHVLVAVSILKLGYKLTGNAEYAALGWFILAGVASVAAAHLLYVTVERRSVRFAARLKGLAGSDNGARMEPQKVSIATAARI